MSLYDQIYAGNDHYFGDQPHELVLRHAGLIRPGGRVLDIGTGQGRNLLPLMRMGFPVSGIDPSGTGLDRLREASRDEALGGRVEEIWEGDFAEFEPRGEPYDAILCFGLLQILPRPVCASLLHRIHSWTAPGSVIMMTAWHVDDPLYDFFSTEWSRAGLHSYRSADGQFRTYLARGEILDLLRGWDVVHHSEDLGRSHSHNEGPEHRHGEVEMVAVRREIKGREDGRPAMSAAGDAADSGQK